MFSASDQRGFTTIELLLAVMLTSVGIISLIGTLDVSRRVTSMSEMKESASHIAEQEVEQLRTLKYDNVGLDAAPASSTNPKNPGFYLGTSGTYTTYRFDQNTGGASAEYLDVDATKGKVGAAATAWSDGRLSGSIYRYVTWVDDATVPPYKSSCPQNTGGVATPADTDCFDYKRITVAVTVNNKFGPQKPILVSALIANPNQAINGVVDGNQVNVLASPSTKCLDSSGQLVLCEHVIDGPVDSFYLYDTPATQSARQDITGSHTTHPTVAATGTCSGGTTSGCPVPDLMGTTSPPTSSTTPPLYSYSTEITGGTWPGGAVVRRDVACNGTVTTTDNTKGHMWVTAPLAAPMKLTGDASLSLSTATFNGATAAVTLCVRFYNVPASITNLVANPPTAIGTDDHTESSWPRTKADIGFTMDFLGSNPDYTIPTGNRLGVRIWVAASSGADVAAIYDHPLSAAFLQVNEAAQ